MLILIGLLRDPCVLLHFLSVAHGTFFRQKHTSNQNVVLVPRRSALRLVSRDVSTATGSLVRGLEIPLSALLREEVDMSLSTMDLSMLTHLVLVGLNLPDVARTMDRLCKETLMGRLQAFLGAALWSGHNVSLAIETLGVQEGAGKEQEVSHHRALRELWGAFNLGCVPASVVDDGTMGWLRLHTVDLFAASQLEDRDVHALLLACHDLQRLSLARCDKLRRPLMPMACPEFVPHLRSLCLDGAWRIAVDELFEVRNLRSELTIDMMDEELPSREVEVAIIQDGSPHEGQWVRCRILTKVDDDEARFGVLGGGGSCAYARFDIFVHETRRFDHAVGFSSKVAHNIERKYLRHICTQHPGLQPRKSHVDM